jgi:hypothetical protein
MHEYDPVNKRLLTVPPPEPVRERIWTYPTEQRAQAVAEALTKQNAEGRQMAGSPKRRYTAKGCVVWAEAME